MNCLHLRQTVAKITNLDKVNPRQLCPQTDHDCTGQEPQGKSKKGKDSLESQTKRKENKGRCDAPAGTEKGVSTVQFQRALQC